MIAQNIQQQPGTVKVILAENQPQYTPLPALHDPTEKTFLTEWALSDEERAQIAAGGVVRLWVWGHFPPVAVEVIAVDARIPLEPVQ